MLSPTTWDGVNEQTKKEAEELFGVKIKVQRRDLQGLRPDCCEYL